MDYLDPKNERANTIRLLIGYALVGLAILIGTLVLLYQAYGFTLDKKGDVIQNGVVFLSSSPSGAHIYLNNILNKSASNAKLSLPAGDYSVELSKDGYDNWSRQLTVDGGSVLHVDYPKLFPSKLTTTDLRSYSSAPGLATQSPDRHWLVVQQPGSLVNFDLYDLSSPKNVTDRMTSFTLPDSVMTSPSVGTHSLKLVEWSTDNRHVMLEHDYTVNNIASTEYIMVDRQDPTQSFNVSQALKLTATQKIALHDKKYDQYYVYDTAAHTLGRTTVDAAGAVTPLLDQVLDYKPYGANMVLYMTDKGAAQNQVLSMLYDNGTTYKIREHGAAGPYLIDLTQYSGDWYVVAGASGDGKVYVYKNPQHARKVSPTDALVPVQIMRMTAPDKLQFSSSTQQVMIEHGTDFADYDAENDKGYRFTSKYPLDAPAPDATWMDGSHITYTTGGKVVVFDYDNLNDRVLVPSSPAFLPYFDRDYKYLYTLAPGDGGAIKLTQTPLLIPADQ